MVTQVQALFFAEFFTLLTAVLIVLLLT